MHSKLTKLLALALLIPLAGCATTGTGATDRVCDFWGYTSWSSKDTPQTIDGNKRNNAKRKAWCG
jgi:hypothetical protein